MIRIDRIVLQLLGYVSIVVGIIMAIFILTSLPYN